MSGCALASKLVYLNDISSKPVHLNDISREDLKNSCARRIGGNWLYEIPSFTVARRRWIFNNTAGMQSFLLASWLRDQVLSSMSMTCNSTWLCTSMHNGNYSWVPVGFLHDLYCAISLNVPSTRTIVCPRADKPTRPARTRVTSSQFHVHLFFDLQLLDWVGWAY